MKVLAELDPKGKMSKSRDDVTLKILFEFVTILNDVTITRTFAPAYPRQIYDGVRKILEEPNPYRDPVLKD